MIVGCDCNFSVQANCIFGQQSNVGRACEGNNLVVVKITGNQINCVLSDGTRGPEYPNPTTAHTTLTTALGGAQ